MFTFTPKQISWKNDSTIHLTVSWIILTPVLSIAFYIKTSNFSSSFKHKFKNRWKKYIPSFSDYTSTKGYAECLILSHKTIRKWLHEHLKELIQHYTARGTCQSQKVKLSKGGTLKSCLQGSNIYIDKKNSSCKRTLYTTPDWKKNVSYQTLAWRVSVFVTVWGRW